MRKRERQRSDLKLVRVNDPGNDVDALFRLPLAEFTGARNALAAQLKKSGRGDDAVLVKALGKPSISAWAVNQLYWNHREAFDELIASGERFHKAQASGKIADMRGALDARREALTDLSDLAASLLRAAGHSPAPDTIHRITTTLEAMSVTLSHASRSNAPRPGRLTHDIDPPGFESFASFVPAAGTTKTMKELSRTAPPQKSISVATTRHPKAAQGADVRRVEKTRNATIAAAKVSLQDAKRSLTEARARAQSLEPAQKKADAEAKKADKHRREVEASLKKAEAASEAAAQRAQSIQSDIEEAASVIKDAERTVEKASKELESLFRG